MEEFHHSYSCSPFRGGFKFFDTAQMGSFYGGFLAQLPRSVHPKVFEFSKKLPKILQVRLLQRDHILADLFGNDYPDFPDVALYFFPSANIERFVCHLIFGANTLF